MFTLVITAMFTLAIRKHLVSRISSFSYISREYCPSTNSYLPHNITILFYFNVFTLWQEKFDFKSSVCSKFACIRQVLLQRQTFCCWNYCWVVSEQLLLPLAFVTKDLKKKLTLEALGFYFLQLSFSFF